MNSKSAKRVVWILGAGFSRSLGAPLLSDLFSEASTHRILSLYGDELADHNLCHGVSLLYRYGAYGLRSPAIASQWEHAEEFLEHLALADQFPHENASMLALVQRVGSHKPYVDGRVGVAAEAGAGALRTYAQDETTISKINELAIRMFAAECCAFLHKVSKSNQGERWDPYKRWAKMLTAEDTVITFNYDRVLEQVDQNLHRIAIPGDMENESSCAIYKLHGSVDWCRVGTRITVSSTPHHAVAANRESHVLATPGPLKKRMTAGDSNSKGILRPLWDAARKRIETADGVVFIGYRIPPSDSWSRQWLLDAIDTNLGNRKEDLRVYTVLGDDTNHPHSRRLRGLLSHHDIALEQKPLFAQDFLALVDRDTL